MHRLETLGIRIDHATVPSIRYSGLVGSLAEAIRKWCVNNIAITDIGVKNSQKNIYMLFLIFLIFQFDIN